MRIALEIVRYFAGFLALLCLFTYADSGRFRYDYLITDVRYLKDQEITSDTFTIGIKDQKIAYIGKARGPASHSIDGHSLVLAPGFLDTNSCGWVSGIGSELKLQDGVTSYLLAHGGLPGERERTPGSMTLNHAITIGITAYLKKLELPGFDLPRALETGLSLGAYGISFSPEYRPEATPERIRQVCAHFSGRGVPISFHARYSGHDDELAGLEEILECARLGNPVHVLHITSTGATYHPREAFARIARERARGQTVLVDFYPYNSWASPLQQARFSGDWQKRYGVGFDAVKIPSFRGKLDEEAWAKLKRQNEEDGKRVTVFVRSIPEETVDFFALETDAFLGSDSDASHANVHPRGSGSFAKLIETYRRDSRLTLAQILYRFSTLAHERFSAYLPGLEKRGRIAEGYFADLVLWDPQNIHSRATPESPQLPSTGVVAAFVNGTAKILDGKPVRDSAETGHFLRGRQAPETFQGILAGSVK